MIKGVKDMYFLIILMRTLLFLGPRNFSVCLKMESFRFNCEIKVRVDTE